MLGRPLQVDASDGARRRQSLLLRAGKKPLRHGGQLLIGPVVIEAERLHRRQKCRLRRMKRGGFEEVSRLPRRDSGREAADTTVSAEEYAKKNHHPNGW